MLKSVHTYCANGFEVYIICIYQCLSRLFIAFFLSAVPYLYSNFVRHKVVGVGHGDGIHAVDDMYRAASVTVTVRF